MLPKYHIGLARNLRRHDIRVINQLVNVIGTYSSLHNWDWGKTLQQNQLFTAVKIRPIICIVNVSTLSYLIIHIYNLPYLLLTCHFPILAFYPLVCNTNVVT